MSVLICFWASWMSVKRRHHSWAGHVTYDMTMSGSCHIWMHMNDARDAHEWYSWMVPSPFGFVLQIFTWYCAPWRKADSIQIYEWYSWAIYEWYSWGTNSNLLRNAGWNLHSPPSGMSVKRRQSWAGHVTYDMTMSGSCHIWMHMNDAHEWYSWASFTSVIHAHSYVTWHIQRDQCDMTLSIVIDLFTPTEPLMSTCQNASAAVCCSVLQCVAVCCSVMQCAAVRCSVLQCVAVYCSVLQCVAVWCSVLQCAAIGCSVLQCVAVGYFNRTTHVNKSKWFHGDMPHSIVRVPWLIDMCIATFNQWIPMSTVSWLIDISTAFVTHWHVHWHANFNCMSIVTHWHVYCHIQSVNSYEYRVVTHWHVYCLRDSLTYPLAC